MSKTKDLNMTRVWRAELKDLKRNQRKMEGDHKAFQRDLVKRTKELAREMTRSDRAYRKAATVANRRILILEGRLS
jgi:hypothetical protein